MKKNYIAPASEILTATSDALMVKGSFTISDNIDGGSSFREPITPGDPDFVYSKEGDKLDDSWDMWK